jgi:type IV secretion system protein VirB9
MRSTIILLSLLLSLPSVAAADGSPHSEKELELITAFREAEQTALAGAQAKHQENENPTHSQAQSPRIEGQLSPDELIFQLAQKVDELRQKSYVTAATTLATQKPKTAKPIGSKTVYTFKEGDIYEIRAGVDRITDIVLQPGESLTNIPVAGDTARWKIGITTSGDAQNETTHVVLKPLDTGIETNVMLSTNRRVYHLRAIASDWYMPSVSWRYPDDEAAALQAELAKKRRIEPVKVLPDQLNFNYQVENDDDLSWAPIRVFDDGQKTYLQMPRALGTLEAPALFVIQDDQPMLVNYRVKGNFYVVDRLFKKAELRAGTRDKVQIIDSRYNKSFFGRLFE